jgi:hypothetical protein
LLSPASQLRTDAAASGRRGDGGDTLRGQVKVIVAGHTHMPMSGCAVQAMNGLSLTGQASLSDPLNEGMGRGMASRRESWRPVNNEGSSRNLRKYISDPPGSFRRHQMIISAQKRGRSLFIHAINTQRQILQKAESADGTLEERARKAFPLARDLLQETTEGLRRLASMAPVEQAGNRAIFETPDLDQIDWPRLLGHSKELENPLVQLAIADFNAAWFSPLISSPASIDEICSRLDRMSRDVGVLIDAQPDELSAVTILQIIRMVARLAVAVAVGLLATAASTATAGGDVASSLLPAAVAVVVTGMCNRLGRAIGTVSQMSPYGELLKTDHDELASMLQELAAFIDPRWCTTSDQHLDVKQIYVTTAVAEVTAQHAQVLGVKVIWPEAGFYTAQLGGVRELLIETKDIVGANYLTRIGLAERLWRAMTELRSFKIPDDLREFVVASNSASILKRPEPERPSVANAATPASFPARDACGPAPGHRSLDSRLNTADPPHDAVAQPPISAPTSTAFNREPAGTKRQSLPTRTARPDDDSMNPTFLMARAAPSHGGPDQPQTPGDALKGLVELHKKPITPVPSVGVADATTLSKTIGGLSALDT